MFLEVTTTLSLYLTATQLLLLLSAQSLRTRMGNRVVKGGLTDELVEEIRLAMSSAHGRIGVKARMESRYWSQHEHIEREGGCGMQLRWWCWLYEDGMADGGNNEGLYTTLAVCLSAEGAALRRDASRPAAPRPYPAMRAPCRSFLQRPQKEGRPRGRSNSLEWHHVPLGV